MTQGIIVSTEDRDTCNQEAVPLGIDPTASLSTFCVPLVPVDGPDDATPTHWGACGAVPDCVDGSRFTRARWWVWNPKDGNRLVASSESGDIGKFWDWGNCLKEIGLKVQRLPMP
jgi:hypothetical protein